MSDQYYKDVQLTEELFEFLQGKLPEGCLVATERIPLLTPDQAATVIWYLGNLYWQVTDHVERCGVCGKWFNTWCEGDQVDVPRPPYDFCGDCNELPIAHQQRRIERRIERDRLRCHRIATPSPIS